MTLAVRWTIGDVQLRGFEMLRLSISCAVLLFGPSTTYLVCVNTISLDEARARTGPVPPCVEWRHVTASDLPASLLEFFDSSLIEGMGWKLAPVRAFPHQHELTLDNDCILWDVPSGMRQWLESDHSGLLAEDADRCLGSFDSLVGPGAFNAGIRGLPPGYDFEAALKFVLQSVAGRAGSPSKIIAEIEEQGLQVAAMFRLSPLYLVSRAEVSICSPFWPKSPELGTCGAHFTGMNARHIPWNYYDRPADDWLADHWRRHRPELYRKAGLPEPATGFMKAVT